MNLVAWQVGRNVSEVHTVSICLHLKDGCIVLPAEVFTGKTMHPCFRCKQIDSVCTSKTLLIHLCANSMVYGYLAFLVYLQK
jgi:hypothetical protein